MAKAGLFEIRDEWLTRPIDNDHVEVLVGVLADGGELPALTVVKMESGALAVVDGNHRFAAYRQAERQRVPYHVVSEDESSIAWWLAAANNAHGKNRSAAEKREAVARAINAPEGADASNVDLARHCGVSVDLVRSVREEVRGAASAAAERRQVLAGERAAEDSAAVPDRTAERARGSAKRGFPRLAEPDEQREPEASRPEPPVTDEAPLPFEPEWYAIAEDCDAIATAIVTVKRTHSRALQRVPGSQEIADLLTRAHGIATRRRPQACPSPECTEDCPVCDGKGYTLGRVEGWEGIVAAATARRAHV